MEVVYIREPSQEEINGIKKWSATSERILDVIKKYKTTDNKQLQEITGYKPGTIRTQLSILRKMGLVENAMKEDSEIVSKKISIGYEKTCGCPPKHINCMTAKEWIQSQVAIWEFFYEKRDIRDKNIHPAVFPIGLPKKCIQLFTHQGELVLDPFIGSGSTLVAAFDLNRNAVGFDLKKEYVDLANDRVAQAKMDIYLKEKPEHSTVQIAIQDEAHNIPEYIEPETISLAVTSPPYANMLNRPRLNKSMRGNLRKNQHYLKVQQYSTDPRDLGMMEPMKYSQVLAEIYRGILPLLKPRAHSIINVTDLWWKEGKSGKRISVHTYVIKEMQKAGYELRNIIIWDRRNLVNKVGIFGWPSNYITLGTTFEYILDFWRPS